MQHSLSPSLLLKLTLCTRAKSAGSTGMSVSYDVVGFAAKNIRQNLLSYALDNAPEPAVKEVESQENVAA